MLVTAAAKCLAALASGLRKKFGTYAGQVSKALSFFYFIKFVQYREAVGYNRHKELISIAVLQKLKAVAIFTTSFWGLNMEVYFIFYFLVEILMGK